MPRLALAALLAAATPVQSANLVVDVGAVAGPGWRAQGVTLALAPPHDLQLRAASVEAAGRTVLRDLHVHCRRLEPAGTARCDDARLGATLPGAGRIAGRARARYEDPRHWHAELVAPRLRLVLDQAGPVLNAEVTATELDYSEPGGRYAAEKLSLQARVRWHAGRGRLEASFDSRGGQAYAEPLFFDFAALPLHGSAVVTRTRDGWRVEQLRAAQGGAGTLELAGTLDARLRPIDLDARLAASDLAPLFAIDVLPFLAGTRLDGMRAGGRATATLALRGGAPRRLAAQLEDVTLDAERLGVSLAGLAGKLNWDAAEAPASRLRWRGGALRRVPLGPSDIAFVAQGRDFALAAPWRQPLLGGALNVSRLALRDAGGAQAAAEFDGTLEPIELAALCRALGWPEFGGTLGGRLPGLTLRDDVWSLDGALEAQVFDGSVRVAGLRAIEPFGLLPRVMADIEMRRLDLERLTGVFSFGRITGRLDGDVTGLRLLAWTPVAFDARLYSTPGYDGSRRISQRAIDSLSRIGGGPASVLSRGFLGVFKDFAYARLGIGCVLRDGICAMSGIERAPARAGADAYYLVRGRLLPRIDVVGYAERVAWDTLLAQLQAARASAGPEVQE